MQEAPLVEHLEELRARIIRALLAWFVGMGVAWTFRVDLLRILKRPLDVATQVRGIEANLYQQTITEGFIVSLKIAAFGGLVIALPFIVYQLWAFIAPGLYPHERRLAVPFILGAGFSFAVGVVFSYYVLLPFAVPFLLGFLSDQVIPLLTIDKYMSQILMYLTVVGLMFELPVLSFLFTKLGMLDWRFLAKNRRIAIVVIVTLAAIITPTADPFNLALLSVPLLLLYEVSIWVSRAAGRGRTRADTGAE
ncbi:twin-arginine translocase subunit TatC [Deinococcota bacterium DY0809b]